MKVAIVGCGYVGTATAKHLRGKSDCTVTATTTTATRVVELEGVAQRVAVLKGNDKDAIASVLQEQDAVMLCVGAPKSSCLSGKLFRYCDNFSIGFTADTDSKAGYLYGYLFCVWRSPR
jgi:Trk K+ transport system NAD-binding subunit